MISLSDIFLVAWCSLCVSFLTYATLPLVSWCSLLFSFSTHTVLYFSPLHVSSSRSATQNDGEAKGCIFTWKIENLKYCWLKNGECVKSPAFTVNSLNGTIWSLCLFPKGIKNEKSAIVVLKREHEHCGPNVIQVKYHIVLLDKDGSVLGDKLIWENDFHRENSVIFNVCKRQESVSESEEKSFLPGDILKVQCQIWKKDEEPIGSELLSSRTVFKKQRRFFVWRIHKISTFKPNLRNKFLVIDKLINGVINFHLVISERLDSEKELAIDIRSVDECINLISFKVSIIDSKGIKVNCENPENVFNNLKKGILFPLSYSKLMNNKSLYLPNDSLSLDCEYVYSFVTSSNECARCGFSFSVTEETIKSKKAFEVENEKSELISVLVNDLKSMYNNAILCDIELRTSTQTFQTHKAILSARSSVFRKMFSNDMKEKNSGHVDIADLQDETVHRMLTYIYTDSLGDLQMESASKLYMAADKYDMQSLKRRCSYFLKNNLFPSTACDVLLLADMHQDEDSKDAVLDYIMNHDKEVFDTQEWKHFMVTNLKLAADVMYQKVSLARRG